MAESKPKVYVYGGGVAGMTAAHELAIRGFEVHLYERERALGPRGVLEAPMLGGMARTQYFATAPKQQQSLYFHVGPLKKLLDRLPSTNDRALLERLLGDEQARRLLCRFLESLFGELQLNYPEGSTLTLLKLLSEELGDALARELAQSMARASELARELGQLASTLSDEALQWEPLVSRLQAYTKTLPDGADKRRMLAVVFSRVLVGLHEGKSSVALLRTVSKRVAAERILSGESLDRLQDALQALLPPVDPISTSLNRALDKTVKPETVEAEKASERSSLKRFFLSHTRGVARGQGPEAENYFPECWLEFLRDKDTGAIVRLKPESSKVLDVAVQYVKELLAVRQFETELEKPSDITVYVQSFADPSLAEMQPVPGGSPVDVSRTTRSQARTLARWVVSELESRFVGLNVKVKDYKRASGFLKASSGLGTAPVARDWVRVIFYRPQLPGEHGYRFFPSYYRHVFDTMQRIPLHDASGRAVGGVVLDNLVPLPEIGIFSERGAPFLMSWNPSQPGDVLSRAEYNRRNVANLNIHSQDLLQFSLRVMRYMTSCSQRRARELEDVSWWEYLEGYERRTGTRLYRYSEAFQHLIQSSSRVLAAFDGANGDARTCGNTYVQLLTQALVPTSRNNCTLNGPTSESWFFHWRRYLESLGVKFHHGELQTLERVGERLVARVRRSRGRKNAPRWETHGAAEGCGRVYFVVATDLLSAAKVAEGLELDVSKQLQGYAHGVPKERGSHEVEPREPETASTRKAWDRLQTISGIQYFFDKHVNVFDGYLYCVDAEWGLSAICSHLVWQDRPIATLSPYQSILSVDIGDWNTPSKHLGIPASQCTPEQLKDEVLRQLRASLGARGPGKQPVGYVLPDPDWVHIDESLEYESFPDETGARTLRRNKAPYLVPIAGDWKNRPGPEPWDPTPQAPRPASWEAGKNTWQAPHGGYPVHHDRLVFAGTYLRTFTRMTTMESANESARHAVNAILDHYTAHEQPGVAPKVFWRAAETAGGPTESNPYEKGFFPTTPQGDYCRIWNPEQHELPDLELLQREDEKSFVKGGPHPWDALGMELLPALLTHVPGAGAAMDSLMSWVSARGAAVPMAMHPLLAVLRHLRTVLETTPPPRGY